MENQHWLRRYSNPGIAVLRKTLAQLSVPSIPGVGQRRSLRNCATWSQLSATGALFEISATAVTDAQIPMNSAEELTIVDDGGRRAYDRADLAIARYLGQDIGTRPIAIPTSLALALALAQADRRDHLSQANRREHLATLFPRVQPVDFQIAQSLRQRHDEQALDDSMPELVPIPPANAHYLTTIDTPTSAPAA